MAWKRAERALKKRRKSHTRKAEEQCQEHLGRLRRLRCTAKWAHARLLHEKRSTVRSHTQHAVMADAARCEGACSALHRPSHRSAFYRPAACSPPHGEFRPRPPHADLCRESPTEAVLGTAPFHPKRHPDTRQNPRWFQGNAPQHGREGSPPTPFEHKCMKRRKFPLPLQGETICLGTR